MGSIYNMTNTVNNMAYIGQCSNDAYKTRIRDHFAGRGSKEIRDAIAEYGKDVFVVELLHDGIIPELLDMYEIEAIRVHKTLAPNGYNIRSGGGKLFGENNPFYGKSHTGETRQKISLANKGKLVGEKNPIYGQKRAKEVCEKISNTLSLSISGKNNPFYGRKHSKESREKVGNANRHPDYNDVKQVFNLLSEDMSLQDKRFFLYSNFPDISRQTIKKWVRKWCPEGISKGLSGKDNPFYSKKHSTEVRRKMSEEKKQRWKDPEYRQNQYEKHNGKKPSAETRSRMSEAQKRLWEDPEHRRKMLESRKRAWAKRKVG